MLNPVNHGRSKALAQRYRVEPYVACADVYSVPPHVGRGGWTWYTGSAAWMYRVAVEYILGLRFKGDRLFLQPAIPSHWPGFEVVVRKNGGEYSIAIENPDRLSSGVLELTIDGVAADAKAGILLQSGAHQVRAILRKTLGVRKDAPASTAAQ
jgi:cyclic beta-1,2-glucan synthetase